jgi:CBS domain-containing protein
MTEKVRTINSSATLEEAAQILLKYEIGGLPVVDNGRRGDFLGRVGERMIVNFVRDSRFIEQFQRIEALKTGGETHGNSAANHISQHATIAGN